MDVKTTSAASLTTIIFIVSLSVSNICASQSMSGPATGATTSTSQLGGLSDVDVLHPKTKIHKKLKSALNCKNIEDEKCLKSIDSEEKRNAELIDEN